MSHTPGPWRRAVGEIAVRYGAVVSDTSPNPPSEYDASELEAYGGYIIAESIAPQNIPIIRAAPDLLMACKLALDALMECRVTITNAKAYGALVDVIAKAEERQP